MALSPQAPLNIPSFLYLPIPVFGNFEIFSICPPFPARVVDFFSKITFITPFLFPLSLPVLCFPGRRRTIGNFLGRFHPLLFLYILVDVGSFLSLHVHVGVTSPTDSLYWIFFLFWVGSSLLEFPPVFLRPCFEESADLCCFIAVISRIFFLVIFSRFPPLVSSSYTPYTALSPPLSLPHRSPPSTSHSLTLHQPTRALPLTKTIPSPSLRVHTPSLTPRAF